MPFLKVVGGVAEKRTYTPLAFWLRSSKRRACLAGGKCLTSDKPWVQDKTLVITLCHLSPLGFV